MGVNLGGNLCLGGGFRQLQGVIVDYNFIMQHPVALVSIEEVIRRKSCKQSIQAMNIDIKTLINPDIPRYTNLLYAPNSQRLVQPSLMPSTQLKPKTVYLKDDTVKIRKLIECRSRQRITRTDVKPTPENSFRQTMTNFKGERDRLEGQQRDVRQAEKSCEQHQPRQGVGQQKMNKTLNSFLFKIELPDNSRASSSQTKKRVKFIKQTPNGSMEIKVEPDTAAGQAKLGMLPPKPPSRNKKTARVEKIPQFIKINLELEESPNKQIPKASLLFAERKAKSVIKLRKKRYEQIREGQKELQRQRQQKQRQRIEMPLMEQFRRFATLQPEVTEMILLGKCRQKKKLGRVPDLENSRKSREVATRKRKRKLLTEKIFKQGDICGWNNQENEDHMNYF